MLELLVQNLIEALVLVLVGVIATSVAAIARVGISYLRVRLDATQYEFLRGMASTVVRYIEQSSLWDDLLKEGSKKKERAVLLLVDWAERQGLPIDYELADRIIEEAVNVMNAELGSIEGGE